ncbi:MAG: hypothetical protein KJN92_05340 [Gemmatimonadetes bacterium]|nr:hypothetical protein [Gemmatimonadota bacterium]
MRCSDAMREILEADQKALAGQGESRLARHLHLCPSCRSMADLVLQEEDRLGAQMAEGVASPDLDRLLDGALGAEARVESGSQAGQSRSTRWRRLRLGLVPVAAAAALSVLFLVGDPPLPGGSYVPPERTAGLGLEVPDGKNAMVLSTGNPEITVLWFF